MDSIKACISRRVIQPLQYLYEVVTSRRFLAALLFGSLLLCVGVSVMAILFYPSTSGSAAHVKAGSDLYASATIGVAVTVILIALFAVHTLLRMGMEKNGHSIHSWLWQRLKPLLFKPYDPHESVWGEWVDPPK